MKAVVQTERRRLPRAALRVIRNKRPRRGKGVGVRVVKRVTQFPAALCRFFVVFCVAGGIAAGELVSQKRRIEAQRGGRDDRGGETPSTVFAVFTGSRGE